MSARLISVSILLLLLSPPALARQPLADRIPADAIAYVGWQGSEELGAAYDKSHLKAVIEHSTLPQFLGELLPRIAERFEPGDDDENGAEEESPATARVLRLLSGAGETLWRRPGALYLAGIDFENETPRLALICDAGDEAQALHDAIAKMLEEIELDDVPMDVGIHGGRLVVLTCGMNVSPQFGALLGGPQAVAPAPALAAHGSFAAAMAHVQKSPAIAAYIDGEALVRMLEGAGGAVEARDGANGPSWADVLSWFGLKDVKRIAWTAGFDGADWTTQAFVAAPAAGNGFGPLRDAQPISDDILRAVPKSATWVGASRFDLGAALRDLRDALGQADPEIQQGFDQFMGTAKAMTAVDFQTDLFDPLGPEWAIYLDPVHVGANYLAFTAVNRVDDAAKLRRTLDRLETAINNTLAGQLEEEGISITVRRTTVGGLEVRYVSLPGLAPAWAISGDHLYLGLYPQSVASAASHLREKRPSILENERFAALRRRLNEGAITGIRFADLPETAGNSYPTFLAMSQVAFGMADMFGFEVPMLVVPPLDRMRPHLSPAGSASWMDEAGWHYKSTSPFPGSRLLATETNIIVAQQAMLVSILLPALNAAKERANRVKCASNLRQIGQGVLLYANDNRGKYPPDLGALAVYARDDGLHWGVFACPSGGSVGDPGADVLADPEKYRQWVNENSHYVYRGARLHAGSGADEILAYEHDDAHEGEGMNILFNDGHVEWFVYEHALQLIEKAQQGK